MIDQNNSEIILYRSDDGKTIINVILQDESVWLSQKMLSELYQTSVSNINQHINNIYEEKELAPEATIKKYLIVQTEGNRKIDFEYYRKLEAETDVSDFDKVVEKMKRIKDKTDE